MKALLAKLKGYRTLLVALAIAVVGVLQGSDLIQIIPPQYVGPAFIGLAILMAVLRTLTSTAWGSKD